MIKKPEVKKIKVIQAPLAGISDVIFRHLIREYGGKNTLLTTEMISSEAINQTPNSNIAKLGDLDHPISFQIVGHKPALMAKAACILEEKADVIDINCGCPVHKIVKGGTGARL